MCACKVGAPPCGSFVIEKTTFSPFCATGRGANGSGGRLLQKRPPHALASPCVATSARLAAANKTAIVARFDLPASVFFMGFTASRINDADALVVGVCDVDLA